MTKLKQPLLSLDAHGTIGKALTFRRYRGVSVTEKMPIPSNPRSLPQTYQRWLYEDYAHYWTQQSETTKAQYRTKGVRYHLTAFQYWMKYNLKYLPDLDLWLKSDLLLDSITYDSSLQNNHATIIGALLGNGRIGKAITFDGIDDRGSLATLLTAETGTIEFFMRINYDKNASSYVYTVSRTLDGKIGELGIGIDQRAAVDHEDLFTYVYLNDDLAWEIDVPRSTFNAKTDFTWHHWAIVQDGVQPVIYLDGTPVGNFTHPGNHAAWFKHIAQSTWPANSTQLACLRRSWPWAYFLPATPDNFTIYHRPLDLATIQKHSDRHHE